MNRLTAWLRCWSLALPLALAAAAPLPCGGQGGPAKPRVGKLVVVGGGKIPDAVWAEFLDHAGGAKARVVVIPTASARADDKDAERLYLESWRKRGVASVVLLHTRSWREAWRTARGRS